MVWGRFSLFVLYLISLFVLYGLSLFASGEFSLFLLWGFSLIMRAVPGRKSAVRKRTATLGNGNAYLSSKAGAVFSVAARGPRKRHGQLSSSLSRNAFSNPWPFSQTFIRAAASSFLLEWR